MAIGLTSNSVLPLGSYARIQRVSQLLTQQEIAAIAGVTQKDVDLFENNQHINPITRLQLIRTLELIKDIPPPRCY